MDLNDLSGKVIGAAIEVHRSVGPGLLESTYEACLCRELDILGLSFERQRKLPVVYKGVRLDCGYRLDLVVENRLLVELKAVDSLTSVHEAQVLTYLRLTNMKLGLLINFNVPVLIRGVKRLANSMKFSANSAPLR